MGRSTSASFARTRAVSSSRPPTAARDEGIKNVMVTAGYISPEAREKIYPFIDAANVDLKAFSETFYQKLTFSHLEDVLDTAQGAVDKATVFVKVAAEA